MPNDKTLHKQEDWVDHPNCLHVLETYSASGQGEGLYTGVPSYFVRLVGCNVGCMFCDTKYSWAIGNPEAVWLNTEDVIERVVQSKLQHVVVTGGEPLQHDWNVLLPFLNRLAVMNFQVTVETSGLVGANNPSLIRYKSNPNILWSVSPKLPHARSIMSFNEQFLGMWAHNAGHLQFKFVYSDPEVDIPEIVDMLIAWVNTTKNPFARSIPIIFQPVTPGPSANTTIETQILEDIIPLWRRGQEVVVKQYERLSRIDHPLTMMVRPQTHVLLYGHKRKI